MFTIYLAGYISGKKMEECSGWRKKIRELYDKWPCQTCKGTGLFSSTESKEEGVIYCRDCVGEGGKKYPIRWLDPLNGQQFEGIDKEGLSASGVPSKAIIHRDYQCVKSSNMIIANLDTFGCQRPLTGTMFELAWAYNAHKPVIVITEEPNYIKHPFIIETASIIVPTVEELIERKLVNYFYKGQHSAIY